MASIQNRSNIGAWFNYLHKECGRNLLSSALIAFTNRKVAITDTSKILVGRAKWYHSSPVRVSVYERDVSHFPDNDRITLRAPTTHNAKELKFPDSAAA